MFRYAVALPSRLEPSVWEERDLDRMVNNLLLSIWEDKEPVFVVRDEQHHVRAVLIPGTKLNETHGEVHVIYPLPHLDGWKSHEVWCVKRTPTGMVTEKITD